MHFMQFRPNNTLPMNNRANSVNGSDDSMNIQKSANGRNSTARKSYNALFYSNMKLTFQSDIKSSGVASPADSLTSSYLDRNNLSNLIDPVTFNIDKLDEKDYALTSNFNRADVPPLNLRGITEEQPGIEEEKKH